MELTKNSHRNTWRAVHETTLAIRDGRLDPALTDWLRHQGVRLDEALFASVRQCDQRLFVGTLVDERAGCLNTWPTWTSPMTTPWTTSPMNWGPSVPTITGTIPVIRSPWP